MSEETSPTTEERLRQIDAVRRFNRFYTRAAGLLEETLTASDFTLTEARVLFEIARRGSCAAVDIANDLSLDPAYLARILRRFAEKGLVAASPHAPDRRRRALSLTEAGSAAAADLQARADGAVSRQLDPLDSAARRRLVGAMRAIETTLSGTPRGEIVLRPHRVGDMGWVIHRQALLYSEEYGWDIGYEGLIAGICGDFIRDFLPGREFCWIAERDGDILGSVFLVRKDDDVAKLRLLYVEPAARGTGLGSRLVAECIATARACGYRRLVLWTNDILGAARRIYQKAGFVLTAEDGHHSFGHDLVGQTWELEL
jgi:DNA-binding MarR family transcriptional regulator/GNAT superfamily N-acetyltransferase